MKTLINDNCLTSTRNMADNSIDIIFTDPPYALGSEVIIRKDGKPDYKKAVDFMNKWEQPDGKFWEEWFIEAMRILKFGGRVIMFGMDRQTMLNKYYACLAGFNETQSLYWFFISNFPKSADLSKAIDKHLGREREVVGKKKKLQSYGYSGNNCYGNDIDRNGTMDLTAPASDLAKKYDGFKYSVSPLKQTCETIMVFQKPYKTGSCLHDTLQMESGDDSITCGALDIDRNRVGISKDDIDMLTKKASKNPSGKKAQNISFVEGVAQMPNLSGRFPSQTFIDSAISLRLDAQSGVSKGSANVRKNGNADSKGKNTYGKYQTVYTQNETWGDNGGCSKILHKCDYEAIDFDLMIYCPKVSKSERNLGLDKSETEPNENNHPTVKPIKLLLEVLKLFKTPNKQVILDCFMGSGSIGVAAEILKLDFIGIELNKDYFEIACKRIEKSNLFVKNIQREAQITKSGKTTNEIF